MCDVNFSIIIPHFNIPELLVRCLRSIPVREDIQVIVVDDCSPCQEDVFRMLERLNRPYLEYYSTPIGGSAGRARNIGLDHAKGKWLVFADADDFFVENLDQILDEHSVEEGDIVFFDNRSVLSSNVKVYINEDQRSILFHEAIKTNNDILLRVLCPTPWGKIINRNLVVSKGIKFDETPWSNDYYFSVYSGIIASKVIAVDRVLYIQTIRENSLSSALRTPDQIVPIKECLCRLQVAIKVQSILDQDIRTKEMGTMYYYAMVLLHNYPFAFILFFFLQFFKTPGKCCRILLHWYKVKRGIIS